MAVTPPTLKALGALCGNVCAFPGCIAPVYDTVHQKLVGEVAHIKAKNVGGPRYDVTQTDEERDGFHNLMFMCQPHHTIIDDPATLSVYTVEVLQGHKQAHESRSHNTIMTEDVLERLVRKVLDLQTPPKVAPQIFPLIISHRTSTDYHDIDYYCFQVSLRNDGPKTVRNFRLEVAIPNDYANPTHQGSMRERVRRVRGDETLYIYTDEDFRGFTLFPRDTSDLVMNIDYQMRFGQYADAKGSITVTLFSDDELAGSVDYSIRDNRSKDRMGQLGLS